MSLMSFLSVFSSMHVRVRAPVRAFLEANMKPTKQTETDISDLGTPPQLAATSSKTSFKS